MPTGPNESKETIGKRFPIVRHNDGYWIEPVDAVSGERIGPYNTAAEAEQDRRGVLRFLNRLGRGRRNEPSHEA